MASKYFIESLDLIEESGALATQSAARAPRRDTA
jgi:hypothetical protein